MADSTLIIRLGLDAAGVKQGANDAKVVLKDLGESTVTVAHNMVELAEMAIAAGKALTDFLLGSALVNIDAQAKLARNIGSSIDGLRSLQLYAKAAGISEEGLTSATAKLNQTIGQGLAGNDKAVTALRNLGLSAEKLQGLAADEKMATLADAIKQAGLSTEQTLAALKELGIKGGTELVDAMRSGGDAIRAARTEVVAFGLSLTEVDAAKVEAANDAMDRVKLALEAIQQRIAVALAPILTALANKFNDVTKSTNGFKDATQTAINGAIKGVGLLADGWRVIHIALKTAELGCAAIASAIMEVINAVVQLGATLYDTVAVPINGWIMLANQFGANIELIGSAVGSNFAQGMHAATDAVEQNVSAVYNELKTLVEQPLPSTAIDEFIAKANEAAAAQAAAVTNAAGGNDIAQMEELYYARRDLASLELIAQQAENQLLLDNKSAFEATMTQIEEQGVKSRSDLSKQIKNQQISDVGEMATKVLAQYSSHSKEMFAVNKAVNIGMAIMNTFKGVSESLATYPMPLAAVMAALHLASGMANVNSIKSQQYGSTSASGSSSSSSGTATAAASTASSSSSSSSSTLMVQGVDADSLFTGKSVRALAEKLQEHQANGGKVVLV